MSKYQEIKNRHPEFIECFFAFSNDQFERGIKEKQLEGKKIYNGGSGLYGTQEGIQAVMDFYDNLSLEIAEQCTPEEVYRYEYNDHECGYTGDDSEAMKIVISYFGVERTKEFARKRKNGYSNQSIEELAEEIEK